MSDREHTEKPPADRSEETSADCPLPSRRDLRSRIPNRGGRSAQTAATHAEATARSAGTPPDSESSVAAKPTGGAASQQPKPQLFRSRRDVHSAAPHTGVSTGQTAHKSPPPDAQASRKDADSHEPKAAASLPPADLPGSTGKHKDRTSPPKPRRASKARRAPRWRVALVLLILVALVGGAAYVAISQLGRGSQTVAEELDFPGPGEGTIEVTITSGELGSEIAQSLVDAGVVKTTKGFTKAFEANSASSTIKPGTYTLKKGMTSAAALAALLDEQNRKDNAVTVTAGQTVAEVKEKMVTVAGLSQEEVEAASQDTEAIGLPAVADGDLEGWLSPGSYDVAKDMTAADIFAQMVRATKQTLEGLAVPEDQWEEVLTKASILEREAGSVEDMPKVARVISNRLEQTDGETRGMLQMDSTVLYGVGKQGGLPTEEDLASDSPYNTYRVKGLPPGPVANPSVAAIEATLNPAEGSWLYFVTVNLDTGETLFTDTLAEQEKNIEKLSEWCEANPGKC